MANLFESLWNGAKDSIESPLSVGKNLLKGNFSEAFDDLKHMPGNQERANSDILASVGIRGWVGDHPGETAGAVVGTIFAAPFVAAATGATAAGTGAAASGAGATAAGTGGAMAYAPTASSVLGGIGSTGGSSLGLGSWGTAGTSGLLGTGTGTAGFGSSAAMTYAPTASSVFSPAAGEAAFSAATGGATESGFDLQKVINGVNQLNKSTSQEEPAPMDLPSVRTRAYQGTRVPTAYEKAMAQLPQMGNAITKNKFM